jgi:hypothetical protein
MQFHQTPIIIQKSQRLGHIIIKVQFLGILNNSDIQLLLRVIEIIRITNGIHIQNNMIEIITPSPLMIGKIE